MPEDWLSEIAAEMTLDDFPEGLRLVAEVCGKDNALKLSKATVAGTIYVPKFEKLIMPRRNERIRREFNGCNHRFLCRKYNLSESQIREILKRKPAAKTVDMFDP
jgi:Mor family transcriptional regulator